MTLPPDLSNASDQQLVAWPLVGHEEAKTALALRCASEDGQCHTSVVTTTRNGSPATRPPDSHALPAAQEKLFAG
ncbi:MAG TPA: hypothetical protein VNL18_11160, partial [Gemmatimonadales bacterium]|nr:hypothetical protein [Gemmatimonadales bacterium]